MILNIHSDASYLGIPKAKHQVGSSIFLRWQPNDKHHSNLIGVFYVVCALFLFFATYPAKAELGVLFINAQEGCAMCLLLHEPGHPQSDNTNSL